LKKIEKIQKRALRYITNDYLCSYSELLEKCLLPTMYVQRSRSIAAEVFKMLNGIGPVYLQDMFKRKESVYSMRNSAMLTQPNFKTRKYGFSSIKYQGAKIWNGLPNEIKDANDMKTFKSLLMKWNGAKCFCSNCDMCKVSMI